MIDSPFFGVASVAAIIFFVVFRDFISDQRREARHREGRDRFNRAVRNAERLGFVETSSEYGDAKGITDISMTRDHFDITQLHFYMQQQEGTIRASLKSNDQAGGFIQHPIHAENLAEFSEKVEDLSS